MVVPKRILIIRTDRIGDVILSTPVIKNLRLAYPHSFIAFMCRPYTKDIIDGNPYLDEVIVYDKYGEHRSFLSSWRFSLYLKKKRFDIAIILHPTNRTHLLTFFAGIPLRIGWDKKFGFLLTHKLPYTKHTGEKHELEYTLDLLRLIEVPIRDKNTFFPIKKEAERFIDRLFLEYNISQKDKIFVIHPSASCISKRWPQKYFIELINLIKKEFNPKIFIVTSPKEIIYAEKIMQAHSYLIDLRGKLTLAQLGALLKKTDIFISNDSGPVHVASALRVPVISIFGRNDKGLSPLRWKPLGERVFFLHKDVGCRRCFAHNCTKKFLCLKAIKPEEVFGLVKKLLV